MQSLGKLLVIALLFVALCSAVTKPTGTKIVGYWGCYPGGHTTTVPQLQTAINKGYNVIIYAFYLVDASGNLSQDPGSIALPTKSSITTSQSFTYLISLFGGENGAAPSLTMTPTAWAQAMFASFQSLNAMYGLDGIDIDLENAWGGTGDEVVCGLRTFFMLMHNAGFVVSMAPQTTAVYPGLSYATGSWNSYAPLLDSSIIEYIDIVAIQLYNNAMPYNDPTQYTNALTTGFQVSGCPSCGGTVTGFVQIPASKLAHGWPSTQGAAPSGCPGLTGGCPYGNALDTLYGTSSVLQSTGGVMTWSVEWDMYGSWAYVTAATQISFSSSGAASSGSIVVTSTPTSPPVVTQPPATQPPVTQAPATQPPATQAPVTQAPATQPPATQAPATQAPATQAPATQAPATQAPVTQAPPTQATTKPTSCQMTWTQTLSSSWSETCGPVSMYTATLTANADVANFQFTLSGTLNSVWNVNNLGNGVYTFPQWMLTNGVIPSGSSISFGYIVQDDVPSTVTITTGDPCQ